MEREGANRRGVRWVTGDGDCGDKEWYVRAMEESPYCIEANSARDADI